MWFPLLFGGFGDDEHYACAKLRPVRFARVCRCVSDCCSVRQQTKTSEILCSCDTSENNIPKDFKMQEHRHWRDFWFLHAEIWHSIDRNRWQYAKFRISWPRCELCFVKWHCCSSTCRFCSKQEARRDEMLILVDVTGPLQNSECCADLMLKTSCFLVAVSYLGGIGMLVHTCAPEYSW